MNSETIKIIHTYIKQIKDLRQSQIVKKNKNISSNNSGKLRKPRTETSLIYPNNYWIFDISEYDNSLQYQFKISFEKLL